MEHLNRIAMTSSQRLESRDYLRKAEVIVDLIFATGSAASALLRTTARTVLVLTRRSIGTRAHKRGVIATVRRLNRAAS
ncbi:MAG: hypothetical protein QOK44_1633 [Betaproteobacteria bacterium]|nr:hypothetical protein [Betaproteobacteria bacterium]